MPRPSLHHLPPAAIAPLEPRIAAFPEVWQELARSCYCTLLDAAGWPVVGSDKLEGLAAQAAVLAMGIGEDMGGAQPYIPVGLYFTASEKYQRVVRAWRAGSTWQAISAAEKIGERRVRQIVSAWQREMFARRQGVLSL